MKAAEENVILYTYTIYNFAFTFFREIKILIFALDKLYCEKHLMKQTEQKKEHFLEEFLQYLWQSLLESIEKQH